MHIITKTEIDIEEPEETRQEPYRNYENTQHWNLDSEFLEPLREFLDK
ncbi:MAG: hypothetical protein ILA04_04920 [Prevotella sp.]|nr:hypothetical protein [Prevotella sp.]